MVVGPGRKDADRIVDGFGRQTLLECIPFASDFDLERLQHPFPDDGYHAEAAEYIALADSVRRAGSRYCIAELGAGWGPSGGPWRGACAEQGRRRDRTDRRRGPTGALRAAQEDLAANGLRPDDGDATVLGAVSCRLFNGAVTPTRTRCTSPM